VGELPIAVFKRWMHSREEDSAGLSVYRPVQYPFPPSRGRSGFEIHPDGVFIGVMIGQADGQRARRGQWRPEGENRLRIEYDDGGAELLTIRSVDDDVLRVEQRAIERK
jgi:hypothetical protein